MAAGEPEPCTSSPFGHLRHISVTMTGSAVVSRTRSFPVVDEGADGGGELLDGGEGAADGLAGDHGHRPRENIKRYMRHTH
jgi:hypothetical protein